MTSYVLDTHAWIWLAVGDARLKRWENAFNRAAETRKLLLPVITLYEASLLGFETEEKKRIGKQAIVMRPTVNRWIQGALRATRVTPVALDAAMTIEAANFRTMHTDPFDRLIVATALEMKARLVTADRKMSVFAKSAGIDLVEL